MNNSQLSLEKKFKEFFRIKGVTIREFCKEIGMTTGNLYKIYERNSIDTKYLKSIAEKYQVPESFFVVEDQTIEYGVKKIISNELDLVKKFAEDNVILQKELEAKHREIELLRQLLESKDEIIHNLKGKK